MCVEGTHIFTVRRIAIVQHYCFAKQINIYNLRKI